MKKLISVAMVVGLVVFAGLLAGCTGGSKEKTAVASDAMIKAKVFCIENNYLSEISISKPTYINIESKQEDGKKVSYVKGYFEISGIMTDKLAAGSEKKAGDKITFWVVFWGTAYKDGYGELKTEKLKIETLMAKDQLKRFGA